MTAPSEENQHQHSEAKEELVKKAEIEGDVSKNMVKSHRTRNLWLFTIFLLLVALVWFCLWYFYLRYYESTDDAYANGNLVNINSSISGAVVVFYADNTDLVVEGQLLAELDPTYYQVALERELAALAAAVLKVRQIYNQVNVSLANYEIKRTSLSKARFDFDNRSQLVASKAISNEDFTHSKDDLTIAENDLKQAEFQLAVAKDAAGNTSLAQHPMIEEQKKRVLAAFYNLKHCSIYAPVTGYIAQRSVEVGQWVTPTISLMAVIPTDYVWVDANFKETQLTYMRIGQPATVWFDLYGSKVQYSGKVLGIASGAGSVFSLIPPQNATGNWIKIVQRLPVRISLDPRTVRKFPVRLGISAEVNVDITNQNFPMLSQVPSFKPVSSTVVYQISFEEIDAKIQQVLSDNLSLTSTFINQHDE